MVSTTAHAHRIAVIDYNSSDFFHDAAQNHVPHYSAALAWMWSLGLAEPRRVDGRWAVVPLRRPDQSEREALEVLMDAFREAERITGAQTTPAGVKNDPEALTGTGTSETVAGMARPATAQSYPDETVEQFNFRTYPTQRRRVSAVAPLLNESDTEFIRVAIEERLAKIEKEVATSES